MRVPCDIITDTEFLLFGSIFIEGKDVRIMMNKRFDDSIGAQAYYAVSIKKSSRRFMF